MPGQYVVCPCCEIDLGTVARLRADWVAVIERNRPDCFVIDLTQVGFVSSSGARLIAEIVRMQRAHGGRVLVLGANRIARRVLHILEVDRVQDLEIRSSQV